MDFSHDIDSVDKNVSIVARGILAHGVTSFCPTLVTSEPQVYKKVTYIHIQSEFKRYYLRSRYTNLF